MHSLTGELGTGNMVLISDRLRCTGMPDGIYGSIEKGKRENAIIVRKEDLSLRAVIKDGRLVENS